MPTETRSIYQLLTEPAGLQEFIELTPSNRVTESLTSVNKFVLRTGTRKAEFLQQRLARFKDLEGKDISMLVERPNWDEASYSEAYMMPGMRAILKAGGRLKDSIDQAESVTLHVSGDVETLHNNRILLRPSSDQTEESIAQGIVELLSAEESTFSVRSSIAGLRQDNNRGAVITETRQFKVDRLTSEEVSQYVMSLDGAQLKRAPAGILWPHPLIISHINQIDGVLRGEDGFEQKMIELLNALLNIPDQTDVLIRFLDQIGQMKPLTEDGNLHKFTALSAEMPLWKQEVKLTGSWSEIAVLPNGELLELSSITPEDYEGISRLAENNFRHAPNYKSLQGVEGEVELQKFIAANSPENVRQLCEDPGQLCNLVAKINGQISGFRVVRKRKEIEKRLVIADGKRLHVALGKEGMGIGSVLLKRSEQIARQQGCQVMEIHATGDSYKWFEKQGYRLIDQVENHRGVFKDKPSNFFLMIKDLSMVI